MDQKEALRIAFGDRASGEASLERDVALAWLREQPRLHDAWLTGLSYSDHAPAEVLCRLLNRGPDSTGRKDRFWLTDRELPRLVYETAARHADSGINRSIAENLYFPVDLLPRLGNGSDAERATVLLVLLIAEVPAEALAQLATSTDVRIRRRVAGLAALSHASRMTLLGDPDMSVRAAALPKAWPELTESEQNRWATDTNPSIAEAVTIIRRDVPITTLKLFEASTGQSALAAAARTALLDRVWAEALVADERAWVRSCAAANPSLPSDLVSTLATDPETAVRRSVAARPGLPATPREQLARDPENSVRLEVSVRADLTDTQRQAIDYVIPQGRQPVYPWVETQHQDPDAMRRLARSSHPLIRRAVAAARKLTADVVDLLSHDDDFFVKLTLAQMCDDAPAQLMVDMYEQWNGMWAFALLHRPTFPREGLAHLAGHRDPRMQALAVRDPQLDPETVQRLGYYEDPRVPLNVAIDHLHLARAAKHPGISPNVMHLMLDLAGVVETKPTTIPAAL